MSRKVLKLAGACALVIGFIATPLVAAETAIMDGGLTLGGRFGEHSYQQGIVDLLVPVYQCNNNLVFINPRGSIGDDSAEELNLGIGYRYLMPDQDVILGANVYYDSRWTEENSHFHQFGFGVEMLTEWIDARANYYLPKDDEEDIGGPIDGIPIVEKSREGWDAEIGFKVPYTEKCGEVRVFGGYYSWDSELVGGDDLDGFKARLEIRPMPAVTFDAEYYEDEDVFDTNYYAGVRVRVPFNIGSALAGENPFAGAEDAFKWGAQRTFESRMGEMVIRDTYIHTEQGIERPLPVDECENGYEPPPYDNGYETAR